MLHVTCYMYEF